MTKTYPAWLYHAVEPARIFERAPGDPLPEGWHESPVERDERTAGERAAAAADARVVEVEARLEAALRRVAELDGVIEAGSAENVRLGQALDAAEAAREAAEAVKRGAEEARDAAASEVVRLKEAAAHAKPKHR